MAIRAALIAVIAVIACSQTVVLSDRAAGRVFDGLGAVSGGGATSRLLFDYPEPQRSAILDLLFKPRFGSALQHLKVEIPGDADTTCGSEQSHRHDAADGGSYTRGYEFALLAEAKRRNPALTTSALQWAAPRFVGEGRETLFTGTDIGYVLDWIKGGVEQWNVTLDFIGSGWNEKFVGGAYDPSYTILLRHALDALGPPYSGIGVTAADEWYPPHCWQIARDMAGNATLRAAVVAIAMHVAGELEHADPTPQVAIDLGVPIWQGEEHFGLPDPDGAEAWTWPAAMSVAVEANQNWVLNNMTSTIWWPAVYGWYSGLLYRGKGFITSTSPWSAGAYFTHATTWIPAHTTHFVSPRTWRALSWPGSGHAPGTPRWNVSYVTYVSTLSPDFAVVLESGFQGAVGGRRGSVSSGAHAAAPPPPTTVSFRLADGLLAAWGGRTLLSWRTNETTTFEPGPAVRVGADGTFTVTIEPSAVVTVTSVDTGHPGAAAVLRSLGAAGPTATAPGDGPADAPFPLPYADDFEAYGNDSLPLYASDMYGAFATWPAAAARGDSGGYGDAPCNVPLVPGAPPPPPRCNRVVDTVAPLHLPCGGAERARRPQRCSRPPPAPGAPNAYVLRQYVKEAPIGWGGDALHFATILGSLDWRNVSVGVNAAIESPAPPDASVFLALRAATGGVGATSPGNFYSATPSGYGWRVFVNGTWLVTSEKTVLARGALRAPFGTDTFRALSLSATDQPDGSATVNGTLSGAPVFSVHDPRARAGGYVVVGTGAHAAQFDNLIVQRTA